MKGMLLMNRAHGTFHVTMIDDTTRYVYAPLDCNTVADMQDFFPDNTVWRVARVDKLPEGRVYDIAV